jgi:hypothetical protein|tara:strand:+ start:2165 stop:2413 length:249 start_codon:yes stop_codon:yes gene_type:complete
MDDFLQTYDDGMSVGYGLIIGQHSFEEVALFLDQVVLPFDPTNEYIDVEDINHMISYFEDKEEYEKCAVLKNFKSTINLDDY